MEPQEPEDITVEFVATPRSSVYGVELDGEAVLYDERTGTLHVLDRVATVVWSWLDGEASLRTLAGELASAFAADARVVERDVVELARSLGRLGLLEGIDGDEPDAEQFVATEGASRAGD